MTVAWLCCMPAFRRDLRLVPDPGVLPRHDSSVRPSVRAPARPRLLVALIATDPYERAVAARALVRAGADVRACACLADLVDLLAEERAVDVGMVDASDAGAARLVTALSTARPDLPFVAYDRRERLEDAIAEVAVRTRR